MLKGRPGIDVAVVKLSDLRGVSLHLPLASIEALELKPLKKAPRDRGSRRSRAKAPLQRRRAAKKTELNENAPPRSGPELVAWLDGLTAAPSDAAAGTRVWVTLKRGAPRWPGVLWCVSRARPGDLPGLADAHTRAVRSAVLAAGEGAPPPPPPVLVLFYGEATLGWARQDDITPFDAASAPARVDALVSSCRGKRDAGAAASAAHQVGLSLVDAAAEAARVATSRAHALDARAKAAHPPCGACGDVVPLDGPGAASALTCVLGCMASFHAVCLPVSPPAGTPALASVDLPGGGAWTCPACATHHPPPPTPKPGATSAIDRQGLTPDWMIEAAVSVFGLALPSPEVPTIQGLLDPCSNSRVCPNIPAEKIYTKEDDGLRLSNSWAGFHIILNPEFKSAVAWRFVNRAIDEVENREVPAILLITRGSTDTNYYQRLRPYPKVLLRRSAVCFKDYASTPIGFGIVVVLMVRHDSPAASAMTQRFLAAFGGHGEPCAAIDAEFAATPAFAALLTRLREHSDTNTRDHWAQCNVCRAWRRVTREVAAIAAAADEWTCGGGCGAPLTREEEDGVHYAPACTAPDDDGRQIGDGPLGEVALPASPVAPTTPRAVARPLPPPSPPIQAADVIVLDDAAVKRAARLPPRPRWAPDADGDDGDGGGDVVTALELARAARVAANRAFLIGLGLVTDTGAPAAPPSQLPCLPLNHPSVLVAARELARQASAATAKAQLESVRAGARARAEERARRVDALRAELAKLASAAESDAAELAAAEDAAREAGGG